MSQQLLANLSAQRSEDAEMRAVRAFLLDKDTALALDSDVEKEERDGRRSPTNSHTATDSSGSTSDDPPYKEDTRVAAERLPEKPRQRQVNHARVRMQKELALLREQATALSKCLAALQTGEPNAVSTLQSDALVAWKTVAQDQRVQREASERERDYLRDLIKQNRRELKNVRRIVRKRVRLNHMNNPWSIPIPLAPSSDIDVGFRMLSRYIGAMIQRVNAVFEDPRISDLVDGVAELSIRNDMMSSMTVELREVRVLPFDAPFAAEALWRCRHKRVESVAASVEQNEIANHSSVQRTVTTATISAPGSSFSGTVHGLMETRRFTDRDKFVVLHCTEFTRTKRNADDPTDQFGWRFFNWTIVRPLPHLKASACQMQIYAIATPFPVSGFKPTPTISRVFRDFTVQSSKLVNDVERQRLENVLLDMDRARSRSYNAHIDLPRPV